MIWSGLFGKVKNWSDSEQNKKKENGPIGLSLNSPLVV